MASAVGSDITIYSPVFLWDLNFMFNLFNLSSGYEPEPECQKLLWTILKYPSQAFNVTRLFLKDLDDCLKYPWSIYQKSFDFFIASPVPLKYP